MYLPCQCHDENRHGRVSNVLKHNKENIELNFRCVMFGYTHTLCAAYI